MSNSTIQEALQTLIMQSSDVTALASREAKEKNEAKTFKILTSLSADSETVLVYFDIIEYELTNANKTKQTVTEQPKRTSGIPNHGDWPEGGIEFDFIFSGRNTDILQFDIKIEGLNIGLLSSPVMSVSATQQIVATPQTKKKDDCIEKDQKVTINHSGDSQPVIPAPNPYYASEGFVDYPNRNEKNFQRKVNDRMEFHKTLSDLQAGTIQPILKIRGNPDLLRGYVVDSITPHIKVTSSVKEYVGYGDDKIDQLSAWEYNTEATGSAKPKAGATIAAAHVDHRKYIEKLVGTGSNNSESKEQAKRFLAVGQYVKVNVYAPRDYPFSQERGLNDEYKVQLFYDGWYQVQSITHNFDGANFTQELSLISIDLYGPPLFNKQQSTPKS